MVDALKNFMSTMTNASMLPVTKQVKKAIDAASSARPLPHFDYASTTGYEPSRGHIPVVAHCRSDEKGTADHEESTVASPLGQMPEPGRTSKLNHGLNVVCDPFSVYCLEHPMLKRPSLMTSAPKPHNVRKYYEFHEQNGRMTTECQELRKAFHELADKGQINRFLKRGPRFLQKERKPVRPEAREKECSTKIVATIAKGYVEGSHGRAGELIYSTHDGARGGESPHITSPHNDPLVVEIEVVSAIVRRILIDTGSLENRPLGTSYLGLRGARSKPHRDDPPSTFGDKTKVRNLEVDFLVVDVLTTYNVILGRPILHKVKVVIASYLLQLQFKANDGSVGKLQGDQRMARECYLASIQPLVERWAEHQVRPGTYRLETFGGIPIPRTWHSSNLRKYYQQ
ncbi:hypothetical protein Cgig2_008783 [Carnegiea gigantea]|uniref:Uncharacterized protein n=1 Tax=Carnegiea gigantea TaxID=171969 RepID=A0A9Q1Q5M7_9CARY|nr:hypothetical protein Cgig2_008783 [Carnegiea gigantea]